MCHLQLILVRPVPQWGDSFKHAARECIRERTMQKTRRENAIPPLSWYKLMELCKASSATANKQHAFLPVSVYPGEVSWQHCWRTRPLQCGADERRQLMAGCTK